MNNNIVWLIYFVQRERNIDDNYECLCIHFFLWIINWLVGVSQPAKQLYPYTDIAGAKKIIRNSRLDSWCFLSYFVVFWLYLYFMLLSGLLTFLEKDLLVLFCFFFLPANFFLALYFCSLRWRFFLVYDILQSLRFWNRPSLTEHFSL